MKKDVQWNSSKKKKFAGSFYPKFERGSPIQHWRANFYKTAKSVPKNNGYLSKALGADRIVNKRITNDILFETVCWVFLTFTSIFYVYANDQRVCTISEALNWNVDIECSRFDSEEKRTSTWGKETKRTVLNLFPLWLRGIVDYSNQEEKLA